MKKISLLLYIAMSSAITSCTCSGGDAAKTENHVAEAEILSPAPLAEICDSAKFSAHMAAHPDRWNAAFRFINQSIAEGVAPGTYPILPDDEAYAIVSEYEPRPADSCRFEAHRKYIDLQYIVEGKELMGVTTPEGLAIEVPYTDDIEFYNPDGVEARYAEANSGAFFTFFPDDPHRPSMRISDSGNQPVVKKIVVKIKY